MGAKNKLQAPPKGITTPIPEDLVEPRILTANTYFWSGGGTCATRNDRADWRRNQVADWFYALMHEVENFEITHRGTQVRLFALVDGVEVEAFFDYHESYAHVYKNLIVWRGKVGSEKRSNITLLRKLQKRAAWLRYQRTWRLQALLAGARQRVAA